MDADARLVMHVVLSECPAVFHGLASLVDVGGGHGTAAAAIARAFPHIKCTVMDLPHVVAEAPAGTGLCFLAGDMFDHIPPADGILLKVQTNLYQVYMPFNFSQNNLYSVIY
jgi:hypothetical protein